MCTYDSISKQKTSNARSAKHQQSKDSLLRVLGNLSIGVMNKFRRQRHLQFSYGHTRHDGTLVKPENTIAEWRPPELNEQQKTAIYVVQTNAGKVPHGR